MRPAGCLPLRCSPYTYGCHGFGELNVFPGPVLEIMQQMPRTVMEQMVSSEADNICRMLSK